MAATRLLQGVRSPCTATCAAPTLNAHPARTRLLEVVCVLALAQVEAGQAVVDVGGDVGVHDVQQHGDAQPMGLVDQRLELLRGACRQGGAARVWKVLSLAGAGPEVWRALSDGEQAAPMRWRQRSALGWARLASPRVGVLPMQGGRGEWGSSRAAQYLSARRPQRGW